MKTPHQIWNEHRPWTEHCPVRRPPLLPQRAGGSPKLELSDIQGNLLRGYSHPHVVYFFLKVEDAARGRSLIAGLLDQVTTADPWLQAAPASTLNLSFTYGGLSALGVDQERL